MAATRDPSPKKKLYIRLSSLGDVVLAMSALEVSGSSSSLSEKVDWLTAHEFADLLRGHPRIHQLWTFDRRAGFQGYPGFQGWKKFCRVLWDERYDEIYDLHGTLRTRLMKLLFTYWSFTERKKRPLSSAMPQWKRMKKRRLSLYGYFLFKSRWPKGLRPEPVTERSARTVGGTGNEKPCADHLVKERAFADLPSELREVLAQIKTTPYVCVMPGSKWASKKWPVENYAELISKTPYRAVVLGSSADLESKRLVEVLEQRKIPVVSAVGNWSLRDVALILKGAWRYLGNDTGLAHLAEALGVPSLVVFGPTQADMGFGPWRAESRALGKSMLCRPCGKDGRYCYRITQRFACLNSLTAEEVLAQAPEIAVPPTHHDLERPEHV